MSSLLSQNVIYADLSDPDFSGYLVKRSKWLQEWRERYFVLKGNKLFYCKDEHSLAHGVIDLKYCLTVKSAEDKTNKPNSFQVATPQESYFLCAKDMKEKDEWIGAIGRAIVRFSSAYTNENGYDD